MRQVLIEARIVEADDNFGRSLGVKLGGADLRGIAAAPGYSVGGNGASPSAATTDGHRRADRPEPAADVDFTNSQFVNLPANTAAWAASTRRPSRCRCSAPRPTAS